MTKGADGHRALFIAEKNLLTAAFLDAWLKSGNTAAAIWTTDGRFLKSNAQQKLASLVSGVPTLAAQVRRHRIPVVKGERLRRGSEKRDLPAALEADTLITLMTNQIMPDWMLERFGERAVNVHPALLPHYKGPNPLLTLAGDDEADRHGGVTIHRLDAGIDTGAIIAQRPVPISPERNFDIWIYKLVLATADLARNDLQAYLNGELQAREQEPGSGSYRKSTSLEFMIEPDKTLEQVHRLFAMPPGVNVRALLRPRISGRLTIAVHRSVSVVSGPTGANPRVTPLAVEMDLRDCRVSLLRKRKIASFFFSPAVSIARYRSGRFVAGLAGK